MRLLEGLYAFELILLLCGIVLFVIMARGLWMKLPNAVPASNWIGFVIAIVMMGYPSIQKISYEDGKLTIEKFGQNQPQDPAQKEILAKAVAKVEARGPRDQRNLTLLARGRAALGEGEQALAIAAEAARLPDGDKDAKGLAQRISVQLIEQAVPAGGAPASNPRTIANLKLATTTLLGHRDLPPADRITLSWGLAALGQTRESVAAAQEAIRANPDLRNNSQVRALLEGAVKPEPPPR